MKYRSMRKIQTQTLKNTEVTMDMTVYGCRTAKTGCTPVRRTTVTTTAKPR